MTSDYYTILGVTPAAEDVVISAAYRALMRHYHPDTNPDPKAQAKARAITEAYAVLRDPAKRAEYDAKRVADDNLWPNPASLDQAPPPAMRGVGITLALLALTLVGAVWAWPQPDRQTDGPHTTATTATKPASARSEPVVELQPESERLANLQRDAGVLDPPPVIVPPAEESVPSDPLLKVPATTEPIHSPPPRRAFGEPHRAPVADKLALARPKIAAARPAPPAAPEPAPIKTERTATLDRMSSSFFTQSMANANAAKKQLLVGVRDRSAAKRKSCRSESCVADAYVRQIRETSAVMEGRSGPPK